MKLCVFDFDSTLMNGETIDEIAAAFNKKAEIAAITHRAMAGELDFFEALTQRVALLAGLSYETVLNVCHNLPLMNGAIDTVAALKQRDYKVVIFSGGFHQATSHFKNILGVDADFANILHQRNGALSGLVGGEMMFSDSKGIMLQRVQELLGVSVADTVAVGDGANDAAMFKYAAKKVAFCAKPILKQQANIIVDTQDLREILSHLE